MHFGDIKKKFLRVFLVVVTILFVCISILGIFGSNEMQEKHHDPSVAFYSAESSMPADHLEDLVAWDNLGSNSVQLNFTIVLVLLSFVLLSLLGLERRFFFKNLYAEYLPTKVYKSPPGLLYLREAFSNGLLNGKSF